MKFNLKMIAVAVAMVSAAGAANAALTAATTGNGSLALVAVNTFTNAWYIRDTGILLNSFLPSGVTTASGDGSASGNKTPTAGLNITSATAGYSNFADSGWSTWYGSQAFTETGLVDGDGNPLADIPHTNQETVRWMLSASDGKGASATDVKRLITSWNSSAGELTVSNGQVNNYVAPGNAGGLASLFSSSVLSRTGFDAPSGFLDMWGLGGGFAEVGGSAGLFYAVRSEPTDYASQSANLLAFTSGGPDYMASFSLASNGDLSYTAPAVPIPAAAWLLGSGLLAMGGAIRRRKAAAQG